jgi:hypothetical protein
MHFILSNNKRKNIKIIKNGSYFMIFVQIDAELLVFNENSEIGNLKKNIIYCVCFDISDSLSLKLFRYK